MLVLMKIIRAKICNLTEKVKINMNKTGFELAITQSQKKYEIHYCKHFGKITM